ncbi:MAG: hypothetical protein LBM97_00080 [Candidatus Nomurabacteria bacterium]|jgi:competence protein ComFC|nr:hypothetical protein [Candidatus Nomurabacteria bacterium]
MLKKASFCCKNYNVFNLIAPDYCHLCGQIGDALCKTCAKHLSKCCKNYNTFTTTLPKTISLSDKTKNPELFALLKVYKYHGTTSLTLPLAQIVAEVLPNAQNIIIIPSPTAPKHIRQRGLAHTELLVKTITKIKGWHCQNLILRTTNTQQVGADSQTRQSQSEKAYKLNPKLKISPTAHYLIFDDISTTGSTLRACKKLLKSGGAKNISTVTILN